MSELATWFDIQAERQEKIVSLQDALLTNRAEPYGWVRLRYFALRLGSESLLHAVQVGLLYQFFSRDGFFAALLVQAAVGLAGNFWWGALELMRKRVRHLYRSGRPHKIGTEIGIWLSLSIQLSLLTAGLSVAWLVWRVVMMPGSPDVVDFYLLAVLLGLVLGIPTRCYHSGIYALRRIYRPPFAILGLELVSFIGVLAFWPWLGSWSLPVASIVSTLVATGITFWYTRRTYTFFRFNPERFVDIRRFRRPRGGSAAEGLECGLSNAIMALDSVLVFSLFVGRSGAGGTTPMFAVFFAAAPVVRAASDWARLFYFDLKRLEIRPFGNLRSRFEWQVLRLSWPVALLLWAFAMVIATLVFRVNLGWIYLLTVPFFLAQSLLAVAQVQLFSREGYGEVVKSGAVVVSGFFLLAVLDLDESVRLLGLCVVMLAAFLVLKARQSRIDTDLESRHLLWPVEWLARIRRVEVPVVISAAVFPESEWVHEAEKDAVIWRRTSIADRIAARLGPKGGSALATPNRIVWYEECDARFPMTDSWVLRLGAGMCESIVSTEVHPDGLTALREAAASRKLGRLLSDVLVDEVRPVRFGDLQERFRAMFPDGLLYDAGRPTGDVFGRLSAREKRSVWRDAIEFARGTGPTRGRSPFEVSAFCPAGELRAIFLVDRRVPRRLRSKWRRAILRLNIRASVAGVET